MTSLTRWTAEELVHGFKKRKRPGPWTWIEFGDYIFEPSGPMITAMSRCAVCQDRGCEFCRSA